MTQQDKLTTEQIQSAGAEWVKFYEQIGHTNVRTFTRDYGWVVSVLHEDGDRYYEHKVSMYFSDDDREGLALLRVGKPPIFQYSGEGSRDGG